MAGFITRRPQQHNHSLRRDFVAEVRLGETGALALAKAVEQHKLSHAPLGGPAFAGLLLKQAAEAYIMAGPNVLNAGQVLAFRPPTCEEDAAFWFLVSRCASDGTTVL